MTTTKICNKYHATEDGRVVNVQTGKRLPEDEPLMLFRAQDNRFAPRLCDYIRDCKDVGNQVVAARKLVEVLEWRAKNPLALKEPDTLAFP